MTLDNFRKMRERKAIWGKLKSVSQDMPGLIKLEIGEKFIYSNSSFLENLKRMVGKTIVVSYVFGQVKIGEIPSKSGLNLISGLC